ncbi:MAG: hypothetical protein Q4D38_14885 [Planctomycetia bacterium]|nr:hypothetical protein [Planctomycetia bacterium]
MGELSGGGLAVGYIILRVEISDAVRRWSLRTTARKASRRTGVLKENEYIFHELPLAVRAAGGFFLHKRDRRRSLFPRFQLTQDRLQLRHDPTVALARMGYLTVETFEPFHRKGVGKSEPWCVFENTG